MSIMWLTFAGQIEGRPGEAGEQPLYRVYESRKVESESWLESAERRRTVLRQIRDQGQLMRQAWILWLAGWQAEGSGG